MKKDLQLILSSTLKTYFIILIGIFILKICGLDYFGLDMDNNIIKTIDACINKYNLEMIYYSITLYIYTYIVYSITSVDNSRRMKKTALYLLPIAILMQYLKQTYNNTPIFVITDLLWVFVVSLCYIKFVKKEKIKRHNVSNYWLFMMINLLFQIISIIVRNVDPSQDYNNFTMSLIANLDYLILSLISHKLFFMRGDESLWVGVVYLFSHLLTLLKKLPINLQNVYLANKSKTRFEKISDSIYIPLYILWNIFTLLVILIIGTLNHSFVECIIILCSFWINKRTFGKPFHMSTALSCFIVSNLTYYSLNRITLPNGISLLVSIALGVLLCYVTSKFVKDKKFYRGIPLEEYDRCIYNIADKDSVDYIIGKMFYVDRESDIYIATKLNYSVRTIEHRKSKIRERLKNM